MLVERVNHFINKGLRVTTHEQGSVRIALEAILLLIYTWNSSLIPGTDLSRSLVTVGREIAFLIDFSTDKHFKFTLSPSKVKTYARTQSNLMEVYQKLATVLFEEH